MIMNLKIIVVCLGCVNWAIIVVKAGQLFRKGYISINVMLMMDG